MWLASRSAAIVAFVLIACSVTLGLYMANGLVRRRGLKRALLKVHEQIALAALVAILLHGVLLLGDKWLKPGLTGIAIPFSMSYRPLWTGGLGIIGGYVAVIVGPTYFIRRRIGARRSRPPHRTAAIVYVFGLIHALQSGTDGATLWFLDDRGHERHSNRGPLGPALPAPGAEEGPPDRTGARRPAAGGRRAPRSPSSAPTLTGGVNDY